MRFAGIVAVVFVTAFVVVSWVARGMPTGIRNSAAKPAVERTALEGRRVDATFRQGSELSPAPGPPTSPSDNDAKRQKIRLDVLQAANASEVAPCSAAIKAELVAALINYAAAYKQKLDCTSMMFCSEQKLKEAADTFSTPLDKRIREQVVKANELGGISLDDFSMAHRVPVGMMLGQYLQPNPEFCSLSADLQKEVRRRRAQN
ncbi:MAG: hypothetical protein A4S14_00355 [Proteobacteria bacterium SG_bin9]|nr:MAG: hypothetical protein A4S14_00355 [Proteobacteria bacterium SG_bin9]